MNRQILIGVRLACMELSDMELAAINNAAQVDFDPTTVMGYEKVRHLFTENGDRQMHAEVKDALAQVVLERLA